MAERHILPLALRREQRETLRRGIQRCLARINSIKERPRLFRQLLLQLEARRLGQGVFGRETLSHMHNAVFGPDGSLIVVLEGLPVSPLEDLQCDPSELTMAEAIAAVVAQSVGSTFGYWQEAEGLLYQILQPKKCMKQGNHGLSRGDLGTHMDNAFLKWKAQPEAILLYGWVNDANAATRLYPLEPNLRVLQQRHGREAVELLGHEAFVAPVSESFRTGALSGNVRFTKPRSLLVWEENGGYWRWQGNTYNIELDSSVTDPTAYHEAYGNLKTVLNGEGIYESLVIQPGMAIIFNQVRTGHSRGPIHGGDRRLCRAYLRASDFDVDVIRRMADGPPGTCVFCAHELMDC